MPANKETHVNIERAYQSAQKVTEIDMLLAFHSDTI